jgi:hypothetical protein
LGSPGVQALTVWDRQDRTIEGSEVFDV